MNISSTKFASTDKQKKILTESRPLYVSTKFEEGLTAEPSTIKFESVQPGTLYVMTFSVRNVSKVGQRIRLEHKSKSGFFVLNYIPSGNVAPGLDVRGEIECRIPVNYPEMIFTDRIVATMGNQVLEIPLFACKPFAKIKFNHLVEFGSIVQGQPMSKEYVFENISDIKGSVKFNLPTDSFLKISPMKFDLEPQGSDRSTMSVRFHTDAKDIGFFREVVKVAIQGALDDELMDVTAQVVEQKLALLTSNREGLLETANFGNLFFGESKTITAVLVNTGPHSLNYAMLFEDEEDALPTGDPQTNEDNAYSKSFSISPMDGTLHGHSQIKVQITYSPILIVPEKGFLKQHVSDNKDVKKIERKVYIECAEMGQKILVNMLGTAITPSVAYTPSTLRFGDSPVNDRRDILMTLTNRTKYSTPFEFPIVATFKFHPTKGHIQPMETVSVVASFLPPQLGNFKTVVHLAIANGLQLLDVKCLGECSNTGSRKQLIGGTDKLPEDFQTQHKFVDPEEETAARVEKKKAAEQKTREHQMMLRLATMKLQGKVEETVNLGPAGEGAKDTLNIENMSHASSHERDHIYMMASASTHKPLDKHHPTMLRKENNKTYDDFLKVSHAQRNETKRLHIQKRLLSRGAIDPSDPYNINMGMERGLEEPELRIPSAGEPLWLASNKDGEGGGGGGKNKLAMNENRLITKKFGATPATQAELRDCSVELSVDDLKLVTASHKIIDFGRVSVGSLSAKNFAVSNDLKQCAMVQIEELEPELSKSKALTQIIPSGGVAGFDIYFSSRVVCKFKKAFTWKINGNHTAKVFVTAEVVPIELEMSKNELVMEFPHDSLEPTLTTEVVLNNPGNAPAEFLWGSAGAFECRPDKGSIPAGKAQIVSVTWNPLSGKRNEEELGLHITGGVDQTLKVSGVLRETKAEFVDKRILLGVMAVGTEKKVTTSIRNTGTNPLVFFLNPLNERLGATITPESGFVSPGDTMTITIAITPKFAMNYDNTVLSAKIRGGKQINMKLAGSSIIPELSLLETSYPFGSVVVGSSHSLPVTITNKTSILTTLILDLNDYADFTPKIRDSIEEEPIGQLASTTNPEQEDNKGNQIKLTTNTSAAPAENTRRSKKNAPNNMWRITILPNATISADLVFRPSVARSFGFKLQLYIQGIQEDKSLNRDVSAVSIASVLEVSNMVIDFGDRIVSRDPLSRMSYFLETALKNLSSKAGLSFEVRECAEVTREFGKEETQKNNSGTDDASGQIFFVSPTKGDLNPLASSTIRVTFQPQTSGDYSKKLEIYLKGQPDSTRPYLTLQCIGSGVFPRLTFSKQHVDLPTVPLGVTSRAEFTLFNNGYNSLDINHRISPNIPVPLEITYPDGNNIGIMIDKIRVQIAYKTDTACAWTGKIEFYDQDGERFFISVSGCSEGCLLTNYPFVRDYSSDYGFVGVDNQPVKFLKKTEIAEIRLQETKRKEELRKQRSLERQRAVEGKSNDASPTKQRPGDKGGVSGENSQVSGGDSGSVKSKLTKRQSANASLSGNSVDSGGSMQAAALEGIDLEKESQKSRSDPNFSDFDEAESNFLLKWLNKNICRKHFDTDRFPLCMVENNADTTIDCIEQLSGKRLKSEENDKKEGNSKRDSLSDALSSDLNKRNSEKNNKIILANKLVYRLQQIINMLMNNGALLGHVNPICLLTLEDHLLAQEYELTRDKSVRFTPAMLNERRKSWEANWLNGCKKSWLEIMYQAVKIYVLSRVNYAAYTKMPGVVLTNSSDLVLPPPAAKTAKAVTAGPPSAAPKAKKAPAFPKDMAPSNIFTHAEAVLLTWASYHLDHAGNMTDEGASGQNVDSKMISFNKRVVDLSSEFSDLVGFCQLIHSHVSDCTGKEEPLSGYTTVDRNRRDDLFYMLHDAMTQLKMDLGVSQKDVTASSRNILLMLLHMYLNLPNMVPRSKIEFTGELGNPIAKKIELKNPSSKKIVYDVTLRGNSDFSIENSQIVIEPESNIEFLVTLNAKFYEPVHAKLTFWGVKDGGQAGSTICFTLVSHITGRKPQDKVQKKSNLYELDTFPLQIKNPFPKDATFSIKLQVLHNALSLDECLKGNVSGGKVKPPALRVNDKNEPEPASDIEKRSRDEEYELENCFINPFWVNEESIILPKNSQKSLTVYCLPFMLGKYTCQVVFQDKETGEFCYQIISEIGLPKAYDKLEFSALSGSGTAMAIRIASKNTGFERAFNILTETRIKNPNKKIKARSIFQNLISSQVVNDETGQCNYMIEFKQNYFNYKKPLPFVTDYMKVNKNMSAAQSTLQVKEIKQNAYGSKGFKKILKTVLETPTPEDMGSSSNLIALNTSVITFSPNKAGQYSSTAVVCGKDNPYDIRVLEVTANVAVPDAKMTLEFRGPARQRIVQDIPITNESQKDWNLMVSVTGKGFSAPKTILVPKHSPGTTMLEVVFTGMFAGNFEGALQLRNPEGNDYFEYTLLGVAEDPLSEDNLVFSCEARKKKVCSIQLAQIPRPAVNAKGSTGVKSEFQRLEIETDLPYVTSAETIEVGPEGKKYDFIVLSPMGGSFTGSLTFRDVETGAIMWYTVTIEVSAPAEERTIDVTATVRKAVVLDITLNNPTDEPLVFDVYINGEGLLGDTTFELQPKGTAHSNDTYELIYSPLLTGNYFGRISFNNERVGELWYKLNLTALPAPPVVLDTIEVMLGTSAAAQAPLDNPLSEPVVFNVSIEDTEHFYVTSNTVSLPAYAQSTFDVFFRPSELNETVSTFVTLRNAKFGEIQYQVSGTGLLPGNMPVVKVEAPLGEVGSTTIQFRNPFPHPLPLDVVLTCIDLSEKAPAVPVKGNKRGKVPEPIPVKAVTPAFGLLMKRTSDQVIAAKGLFQIALSFSPLTLGAYEAIVQFRATVNGRNLLWCYPIVGIAEAGTAIRLPLLKTPCKTSLLKEVDIPLEGIRKSEISSVSDLQMSDFTIESIYDDKCKALVLRSFRVQAVEAVLQPDEEDDNAYYPVGRSKVDYALKCKFLFEPLKTFATRVEVVIVYKNKGKWRVNVDLEASDPAPDDRIHLCAAVGAIDKVTFKLTNRFLGFSNFQAYFSAKSSPHFSVTPATGVLAPYGAVGTPFTITFAPLNYGSIEMGNLMVITEDAQWNYEIRGSYPDTTVNQSLVRSKVDTNRHNVGGGGNLGSYTFHK